MRFFAKALSNKKIVLFKKNAYIIGITNIHQQFQALETEAAGDIAG